MMLLRAARKSPCYKRISMVWTKNLNQYNDQKTTKIKAKTSDEMEVKTKE